MPNAGSMPLSVYELADGDTGYLNQLAPFLQCMGMTQFFPRLVCSGLQPISLSQEFLPPAATGNEVHLYPTPSIRAATRMPAAAIP